MLVTRITRSLLLLLELPKQKKKNEKSRDTRDTSLLSECDSFMNPNSRQRFVERGRGLVVRREGTAVDGWHDQFQNR